MTSFLVKKTFRTHLQLNYFLCEFHDTMRNLSRTAKCFIFHCIKKLENDGEVKTESSGLCNQTNMLKLCYIFKTPTKSHEKLFQALQILFIFVCKFFFILTFVCEFLWRFLVSPPMNEYMAPEKRHEIHLFMTGQEQVEHFPWIVL